MDVKTQQLVISSLSIISVITLLGVFVLLALQVNNDLAIITALIGIVSTIIGILGGFLANKNLTEKQEEIIEQIYEDEESA